MIKINSLYAGYSKKEVLKNINLALSKGTFAGIIGRNGAGKSTLLKVLCGLLKYSKGEIFIDGRKLKDLSKRTLSQLLSFMPQDSGIFFSWDVREFIQMGRYPRRNAFRSLSQKDEKAIDEIMDFLEIRHFAKERVNELSGGERQKILIAQTIAQETDLLIFDEPTSHLDIGAQSSILNILKFLNEKKGKTIIATMHDLNAAGEFCKELILIDNGAVKNSGSPEAVLNYKDIEEVYKTNVVVKTNPISQRPFVIPVVLKDN